jgi:hypothetical protein
MTIDTLDTFFLEEINPLKFNFDVFLPKDRKILISFRTQLTQHVFFTERQANLLIKILKENKSRIGPQVSSLENFLSDVKWSQPFRIVKKFREVFIDNSSSLSLTVKFNFDKTLRDKIYSLSSQVEGKFLAISSNEFKFSLNENNLMLLIDSLKPYKFSFDEKIEKIHQEIEKIRKDTPSMFDIFSTTNNKIINSVKNDIGSISLDNVLLLQDRKFRYQYKISEKIEENSLSAKIAQRDSVKIFINKDQYTLSETIKSLIELKRLPVLLIFEGHSNLNNKNCLDLVNHALTNNNIVDDIGIYFRFDANEDTHGFNKKISEIGYNKVLSENTSFAGIANNKLPKFMLKSPWRPKTVISFTNNFKSNKSAVYSSQADLVIFYNTVKPLYGNIYDIV